ncbi:MAG: AMP-binding protein [Bdellovibrionales bacterium]|nr:AMP-binding protein [Bdellovibrionales bacterium]
MTTTSKPQVWTGDAMAPRRYLFGEWRDGSIPFSAADAAELLKRAREQRDVMARYPLDRVLACLERVRDRWADPTYGPRVELLERMPAATGWTRAQLEQALGEMYWVLSSDVLMKKVRTELGNTPRRGEVDFRADTGTALRWHALGVVLHVLAGNVFTGALGSLVEGLLTGNVNILKSSSDETWFLPRFLDSLIEADLDGVVASSIAVIDFSSSQSDVLATLKSGVDGVVVWGGEQAVRGYREGLPARTRLVVFGPKLSLALVTREGVARRGVADVARALADEVSSWDQAACTAPQVCFVEGRANAEALAEALAVELERTARELPAGEADLNQAVEIQKLRSLYVVAEARGEGRLLCSRGSVDWTVILDGRDSELEPSPLHRTIRVVPVESADFVWTQFERWRGTIQTLGLVAGSAEAWSLSERAGELGALRVVELGQMSGGESDDPHDGAYDLPQLMRRVLTRVALPASAQPEDLIPWTLRKEALDSRLRELVANARRASWYAQSLAGLEIHSLEDLERAPILTREVMEAQMAPQGSGLATRPLSDVRGGYVTRSGGSTGRPKFSFYDGDDWAAMVTGAVRLFRAMGLERGDRVANCMLAGDLYGSFLSFDHVNRELGCTSFAFAGAVTAESFVDLWHRFGLNAIQGVPSSVMPMLREAKRLEPALRLEKFMYAGAPLSRADREWLVKELGARRVASIIGATDGAQFGYQTAELEGSAVHRTVDEYNWVEIVDEEGRACPVGVPGRILITSLRKQAFPLIRYAIGDAGRWVEERCEERGRPGIGRRFEYLGRADQILVVGLANLDYGDFKRATSELPLTELQLAARTEEGLDYLVIRAEAETSASEELAKLESAVREAVLSRVPRFSDLLESRSLGRLEIEVRPPLGLARVARTGKVRGLVDER